ncbi:MAG: biopolymer transporter ExbD [Polaromonas sp.]|nr:biopolymer transporter ExbD [Gemmatimonadaceae bacterium]
MRRRRREMPLNAEINVVSLIDVMLLLLVIFMITAPMMQGGVDVALPKAEAKPLDPKSGMVVTIDKSGAVYVDETRMTLSEFRSAFRSLAAKRTSDGVYLRGDAGVPYGIVTQVIAIMRAAGVGDVGLMTDPEQSP